MPAAMIAEWLKMDGEQLVQSLREAAQKLDFANHEMVLDFSCVRRIDAAALTEMETLAAIAEDKAIKIGLRSVNVDVYRVLKLVKLAPRFSFLT